jgi:SET domain-containing protein
MSYKPLPNYLTIKKSNIQGLGLFSLSGIEKGRKIGITHIFNESFENNYIRTPLGGFINHSNKPNCELIDEDEQYLILYTICEINENEEITLKYKMYSDFI